MCVIYYMTPLEICKVTNKPEKLQDFYPFRKFLLDFPTTVAYNDKAELNKHSVRHVEKSRSPAERARLEIVYTPKGYRGFKSLLLRHRKPCNRNGYRVFLFINKETAPSTDGAVLIICSLL